MRFLLTHLVDPAAACRRIAAALRPGGTAIVEDVDFRGSFCHPDSPAYRRSCDIYVATALARGGDPSIGPRLPELLRAAASRRSGRGPRSRWASRRRAEGAVKRVSPLTLENIADAAVAEGVAARSELTALTEELHRLAADPHTLMSAPRIVQVAARRPDGAP